MQGRNERNPVDIRLDESGWNFGCTGTMASRSVGGGARLGREFGMMFGSPKE
jgi:hypothetical protein